jgi:hypothetical protein
MAMVVEELEFDLVTLVMAMAFFERVVLVTPDKPSIMVEIHQQLMNDLLLQVVVVGVGEEEGFLVPIYN